MPNLAAIPQPPIITQMDRLRPREALADSEAQERIGGGLKEGSLARHGCCGKGPVLFPLPQSQALPELGESKEP